jgi:hypothetical protein
MPGYQGFLEDISFIAGFTARRFGFFQTSGLPRSRGFFVK